MKTSFILAFLIFSCEKINQLNEQQGSLEVQIYINPLCGNVQVGNNSSANPCGYSDEKMDEIYGQYSVELASKENKINTKVNKLKKAGKIVEEVPYGEYFISVILNTTPKKEKVIEKTVKIIGSEKVIIKIDIDTGIQ